MTREEIIQGLQFTIDMFLFDPSTGEVFEEPRNDMDKTTVDACKGAIELLMQEFCEDVVSRVDALKALDYDIKSFEFKSGVGRHMNEIANLLNTIYEIQSDNIKALPPVQSKQKTGHWIPKTENWWECSDCGRILYSETELDRLKFHAFCGRCGAKMIEPQESEE